MSNYLRGEYDIANARGGHAVKAPVDRLLCVAAAVGAMGHKFSTEDMMEHLQSIRAPLGRTTVENQLLKLKAHVSLLEEHRVGGRWTATWVKVGSI